MRETEIEKRGLRLRFFSGRHAASECSTIRVCFILFTFGKRVETAPKPMTLDQNPVTLRLQGSESHEQCACCPCLEVSAYFCAIRALPYDGERGEYERRTMYVHHPGAPKAIATTCSAGRCPTQSGGLIIQYYEEMPGDGKHKVTPPME